MNSVTALLNDFTDLVEPFSDASSVSNADRARVSTRHEEAIASRAGDLVSMEPFLRF